MFILKKKDIICVKKEITVAVNFQHCTNNKAFTLSVEIVPHKLYRFAIERIDFFLHTVLNHFFIVLELKLRL